MCLWAGNKQVPLVVVVMGEETVLEQSLPADLVPLVERGPTE